jgi:ABC-2 type transport system ATP-binding protein
VVPDGAFFGLLGPNGAGKTTLISAVCNLIRTTAGEARIFGHDHGTHAARALMHEPRLVILDEPTAGVDFELRMELWAYIRRLHGEGTTILLTTHYLEEAEELCEEIALIRGGRLLARDSAAGLRTSYDAVSLADVYVKAMAS